MKLYYIVILFVIMITIIPAVINAQDNNQTKKIRYQADTIGFSSHASQMDEFMNRLLRAQYNDIEKSLDDAKVNNSIVWKAAICPHDDYTYVGYLYPALLTNVKAKTIILIGVCHKAKQFGLENKIIFDSYTHWRMPYGDVPVSNLRNEIIKRLPLYIFEVNDTVQAVEHSTEAIIPFLQYFNKEVEIISILIPYMGFDRMNEISIPLSSAIKEASDNYNLQWGTDFAVIISTDAVHYGDKDWGGKNFAFYGSDSSGYVKAVGHEMEIINNCLTGGIMNDKIKKFVDYTVREDNYTEYKWTWCGRYSVPFGLMTVLNMQKLYNSDLEGVLVKYATSIDHSHIPVFDIGMGITAPANLNHWVGYAAIGYR
ncbi:MAG TPA: AmmeMemoRadiSam system protein B [Ignavibacteria bacterium]